MVAKQSSTPLSGSLCSLLVFIVLFPAQHVTVDVMVVLACPFLCSDDPRSATTIVGVLRGNTIRGNTTRSSERKMALFFSEELTTAQSLQFFIVPSGSSLIID